MYLKMLSLNNSNNIQHCLSANKWNIRLNEQHQFEMEFMQRDWNASQFKYWTLRIEHYYDILCFIYSALLLFNSPFSVIIIITHSQSDSIPIRLAWWCLFDEHNNGYNQHYWMEFHLQNVEMFKRSYCSMCFNSEKLITKIFQQLFTVYKYHWEFMQMWSAKLRAPEWNKQMRGRER